MTRLTGEQIATIRKDADIVLVRNGEASGDPQRCVAALEIATIIDGATSVPVPEPIPEPTPAPTPSSVAPRPDTKGWTSKALPTAGGVLTLDDDTDFVLTQTAPLTKCLTIKGGRNIAWIHGESKIDRMWSNNEADIASVRLYRSDDGAAAARNDGRIIHIENFRAHGYYTSGDIQAKCPEAIVQIRNCRIECGAWGRISSKDGIGSPHPDIIQLWGGVKELRVDGLTGLCTYQGLQINQDKGPVGKRTLRRVNLRRQDGRSEAVDHSPRSYPNYLLWLNSPPGSIDFSDVYLDHPTRALAKTVWPEGQIPAGVRAGNPPGGDFVPAGSVGLAN